MGVLERWSFTALEQAVDSMAKKKLCGVCSDEGEMTHKEGGSLRVKRDKDKDVKNLVSTLLSVMMNPFDGKNNDRDVVPLLNSAFWHH